MRPTVFDRREPPGGELAIVAALDRTVQTPSSAESHALIGRGGEALERSRTADGC